MSFVELVFNLPIHHAFTYKLPPDIQSAQPGMRAFAPFGNRTLTGVIISCKTETDLRSVKTLVDILDEKPLLDESMLAFTRWIADYYACGWGEAIAPALPRGIDDLETVQVHLGETDEENLLTERQKELYFIIGMSPGNTKQYYRKKFGAGSFNFLLQKLVDKGFVVLQKERKGARVRELTRKHVCVSANYVRIRDERADYQKYIRRRPEIDQYMLNHLDKKVLMSDYLKETGMSPATLAKMAGYGLCEIIDIRVEREVQIAYQESINIVRLTVEQKAALEKLEQRRKTHEFSVFLLHGVTGSGKTQVYIELLRKTLEDGKSAIILIPEIALTPQTVSRFQASFAEKIAVFHSKMSLGERYDAWMNCANGRVKIAVGPRSALFAPLRDIGLIVVDEEHESTYKQADTTPRYHARDAAVYRGRQHNALVVLGSATPSLESYYNARTKKYHLLEIRNRVDGVHMPHIHIVDMKAWGGKINRNSLFSKLLIEKIGQRIQANEQIILLQNRRGYSSYMQCKNCGYIPICPNCDLSLTYHSWDQKLQCHLCGHHQPGFYACPSCGGKDIQYKGIGTQRIQNELLQIFPDLSMLRMDQDTTRGKNKHDQILNAFGKGKATVLLGTQMIAKGLDFPNVTLVGVISADIGLAIPDFRSSERVFQLLTQVAGRSGRGDKFGEVVVQTFLPHHYGVQYAEHHDFTGFYMEEMQHRQNYNYPPFKKMIQILFSSVKSGDVIHYSRMAAAYLRKWAAKYCAVYGPAPAMITRVQNHYRWQITLKLSRESGYAYPLKQIIRQMIFSKKIPFPTTMQVIVDVDPVSPF